MKYNTEKYDIRPVSAEDGYDGMFEIKLKKGYKFAFDESSLKYALDEDDLESLISDIIEGNARCGTQGERGVEELTFVQLVRKMVEFNKANKDKQFEEGLSAVIVFSEDSFRQWYDEDERSFRVNNTSPRFRTDSYGKGYEIYGDCLDGSADDVRLDIKMADGLIPDYCYIEN